MQEYYRLCSLLNRTMARHHALAVCSVCPVKHSGFKSRRIWDSGFENCRKRSKPNCHQGLYIHCKKSFSLLRLIVGVFVLEISPLLLTEELSMQPNKCPIGILNTSDRKIKDVYSELNIIMKEGSFHFGTNCTLVMRLSLNIFFQIVGMRWFRRLRQSQNALS